MGETVWRLLFDTVLDVDESADERNTVIVGDQDVRLLGKDNRIALSLGEIVPLGPASPGLLGYDLGLRCAIHPHPGCRFQSAKLVVDLTATPGATVLDMAPREVRGTSPVEVTTRIGAGMSLEVVPSMLTGEVQRERSTRQTVHQPVVLTSGRGMTRAMWDFRSVQDADLQPDRELRLLVAAPVGITLAARFNLRAEVVLGRAGRMLRLMRKKSEIDHAYHLVDLAVLADR